MFINKNTDHYYHYYYCLIFYYYHPILAHLFDGSRLYPNAIGNNRDAFVFVVRIFIRVIRPNKLRANACMHMMNLYFVCTAKNA